MLCRVSTLVMLCVCLFSLVENSTEESTVIPNEPLVRQRRALLLKKKILGAGAIGLGLGIGIGALKGYKHGYGSGHSSAPTSIVIERPYYADRPIYYPAPSYGNYYTRRNSWTGAGSFVPTQVHWSSHGYYR